jgi:hypothetical protein
MSPPSTAGRIWRAVAFIGASLLAVGIGAGYFDAVSRFQHEFISDSYEDVFGPMALAGLLIAIVGCIGWARHRERKNVRRMAWTVFLAPWAILLLGYPIEGVNIHGYSAFAIMLIFHATLLSFVLGIMAVRKVARPVE